jgi:hypothetical protein
MFSLKQLTVAVGTLSICLATSPWAYAQSPLKKNEVLLFASFRGNGEDGLHLASSPNGYKWTALRNDQSFLKPTVSKDKLMRDPCIIRGHDGRFHMVWTTSWHERGIGYASSDDLIHWTEQQDVPVMATEPTAKNCWAPEITYDAKNHQYLIYWATTIPGRFPQGETTLEGGNNQRLQNLHARQSPLRPRLQHHRRHHPARWQTLRHVSERRNPRTRPKEPARGLRRPARRALQCTISAHHRQVLGRRPYRHPVRKAMASVF